MIRLLIAAIIFGLIGLAIIFMVIVNFTYKGVKKLREEAEDAYYRNQKLKEQKERNPFNGDYFKGSKGGRRASRTQAQYEQREQPMRDKNPFGDDYFKSKQQEQTQQQPKNNTARRTTTSSGVTIIDDREGDKKIFSHDDGEYVDFEEVHN
jgi:hypothetical protein